MSIPCKFERSQLSYEEFETVRRTHHPAIYSVPIKELRTLKLLLAQQRAKARALARQKQREMRQKAEPRGKSFPGTVEQPLKRKQIFAAALKRVNRELDRLRKLEARTVHVEAAWAALAQLRSARFVRHPGTTDTPRAGMWPRFSTRKTTRVPRSRIGSISQATKVAQAIRDSRRRALPARDPNVP